MRKKAQLSSVQARRLILNTQLLDGRAKLPNGKEGIAQTIEKLGYIQIDTISVIERAHHHTLWTRQPDYKAEMLHELQAKDRRIFEYWGHAISYLPMSDYRYYIPKMRNFENPTSKWARLKLEKCRHLMQPVLERIRQEGPLSSKDFDSASDEKGGTWWDWKPAKIALEMLFWKGDLMIAERRRFQKIYDLTERVLPDGIDTRMPSNGELGRFFVRRALAALGVAQEREIQTFLQPESSRDSDIQSTDKEVLSKALIDLVDSGEVTPVKIQELEEADYFALSTAIESSARLRKKAPRVFLLSPFDNLIIQRDRTKRLFEFDYTLECYVPAAKRKYGYFVLPILWGERLIGRLDAKADRQKNTLLIRNLVFEAGFKEFDELLPAFGETLCELARFNRCEKIKIEKVSPVKIRAKLKRIVST